jgi:putative methylase
MRKKELEIKLQKLKSFEEPKAKLEQYRTPADVASSLLWNAHFNGDIADKVVCDLGCGTGTLAIGAKLLGAGEVIGIDSDPDAVGVAKENANDMNLDILFKVEDVENADIEADTVLQNPPFGSQKKGNDRPFIVKSLEIAPVVYSFHMTETEDFVEKFVEKSGGRVTEKARLDLSLPRTMPWHEKKSESIRVTLYRFVREE